MRFRGMYYVGPILSNDRFHSAALFSHGSLEFKYFEHADIPLFLLMTVVMLQNDNLFDK